MTVTVETNENAEIVRGMTVLYVGSRAALQGKVLQVYAVTNATGRLVLGYGKGKPVAFNVRPSSVVVLDTAIAEMTAEVMA